jgi:uncharacterized protein (TIGR02266 family)
MTLSIKPESIASQAELVSDLVEEAIRMLEDASRAEPKLRDAAQVLRGPEAALRYLSSNPTLSDEDFKQSVQKVNETLRTTLESLQSVPIAQDLVSQPVENVARSLALLYPLTSAARDVAGAESGATGRSLSSSSNIRTSFRPRGVSGQNLPAVGATPPSAHEDHPTQSTEPQGAEPEATPPRSVTPLDDGKDRRRAPRINIHTDVSFESESNFYTGFSEDLSDGGVFIATYALRPIGETIDLSFTLPNGHIVNVQGTVRWVRETSEENTDVPPGLGIQFDDLSDSDRAAILDFVRNRAPLFYDE